MELAEKNIMIFKITIKKYEKMKSMSVTYNGRSEGEIQVDFKTEVSSSNQIYFVYSKFISHFINTEEYVYLRL